MTIRSAESWGTKMRRLSVLLLLLALLLTGCATRFSISGGGYLNEENGLVYQPLSAAFEATARGEEVGTWENKKAEVELAFYKIPLADDDRFLTDDIGTVYAVDGVAPDTDAWNVKSILVCDESAVSVAVASITDAAVITQIRMLWQEGEEDEMPYAGLTESRSLKMVSDDCPGIYYCVLYMIYDDGTAYFYDRDTRRTVLVGDELRKKIPIT